MEKLAIVALALLVSAYFIAVGFAFVMLFYYGIAKFISM